MPLASATSRDIAPATCSSPAMGMVHEPVCCDAVESYTTEQVTDSVRRRRDEGDS